MGRMQNMQYDYLDDRYQNITILGNEEKKSTYLVKDTVTAQILVKKYLQVENAEIYRSLGRLKSFHLAQILHVAEKEDKALVIMEYVGGRTIAQCMEEVGVFSEKAVLCYIEQLVRGLVEIHQKGIIHRDINPKNVLISTDGVIKLLDFDIGRRFNESKSSDTMILGTVGYAAPEQFGFTQSDRRTDVYAIGVLMNVMLTGKLPKEELYSKGRVGYIIRTCIQMDPEKRYQSAEGILWEIELLCRSQGERSVIENRLKKKEGEDNKASIIPGFRTGKLWKKIIAVTYYLMMGIFSVSMIAESARTPLAAALEFMAILTYAWLAAFLPLNFLDWMGRMPVIRNLKKGGRVLLGILLWVVLFYFGVILENYVRMDMLGIAPAAK